jgi:hypothetical protein
MRLVQRAGAMLQHSRRARLVERRSVSGGQARLVTPPATAASILGFERGLVLETGLAQARGKVDESRADDLPARVDRPLRGPAGGRRAQRRHATRRDVDGRLAIDAMLRVDHAGRG